MKIFITITVLLALIIAAFFVWNYFFSIYETKVILFPHKKIYFVGEKINMQVSLLNSFGNKIPFRKISLSLSIPNGEEKIEIVKKEKDSLIMETKEEGNVRLELSNEYSLQNEIIEFTIKEKDENE